MTVLIFHPVCQTWRNVKVGREKEEMTGHVLRIIVEVWRLLIIFWHSNIFGINSDVSRLEVPSTMSSVRVQGAEYKFEYKVHSYKKNYEYNAMSTRTSNGLALFAEYKYRGICTPALVQEICTPPPPGYLYRNMYSSTSDDYWCSLRTQRTLHICIRSTERAELINWWKYWNGWLTSDRPVS